MAGWVSKLGAVLVAWGMLEGCGAPAEVEDTEASSGELTSASGEDTGKRGASCFPVVAGTERVKSSLPPADGPPLSFPPPAPDTLVNFRGRLYFIASPNDNRSALWRSDGTSAGTVPVKDFIALDSLTPTPSRLFFQAKDAVHGYALWVSDGTPTGTRLLKDLTPGEEGDNVSSLSALGERLVFFRWVKDPKTSALNSELWTSDGTPSGTVRVLGSLPVGAGVISKSKHGDALVFQTWGENGVSLWRTDGTRAGTARLKDIGGAGTYSYYTALARTSDGRVFFPIAKEGGKTEMWTSDGTKAGTRRLNTSDSSYPTMPLGVLGSSLYVANTFTDTQRLVVNRIPVAGGAETPVITLTNENAYQHMGVPVVKGVSSVEGGKKVYFIVSFDLYGGMETADAQLWVTDGTAAGTRMLHRPLSLLREYHSSVYAAADDLVFFSAAQENTTGIEPWVTNGTPRGTRLLKNLAPGTENSYPSQFFRLGSRVFFNSHDATHGGQLWSARLRTTCSISDSP